MATKQTNRTPSIAAKRSAARTEPNGSAAARKRAARSPVLGTAGSTVKQGIAVRMKGLEKNEGEIALHTVADMLRAGGSIAKERRRARCGERGDPEPPHAASAAGSAAARAAWARLNAVPWRATGTPA